MAQIRLLESLLMHLTVFILMFVNLVQTQVTSVLVMVQAMAFIWQPLVFFRLLQEQ